MQNQIQAQPTIEELRERNERMDLMIDIAFKERLYSLLNNPASNPEEVFALLKMHEKRQAQKLKESTAKLKQRELELKERLAERRLALEERKQNLNERKFQHNTDEVKEEKPAAPAPVAKEKTSPPSTLTPRKEMGREQAGRAA